MNRALVRVGTVLSLAPALLAAGEAVEWVKASGVRGDLAVHLGCGDGQRTAALRVNDGHTVYGLDADGAKVAATHRRLLETGVYGRVA